MTPDDQDRFAPLPPELSARIQLNATGFPLIPSPACATPAGTPYLRAPGVALLAKPQIAADNLADFLGGFAPELHFMQYLDDPTPLTPASQLCKTAGQLCYMSFAPKRTLNADADRYFHNIKESGHGSVLEHANFTFLFYGVSRSLTHELIRHRAGFSYCLAGHTQIYAESSKNRPLRRLRKWTIEELYLLTQTNRDRSRLSRIRLRCLDEHTGSFTSNRIKTIARSGSKPVFRVELEDGKAITCSKEHRFLTPDGWQSLAEIVGGLEITQNGIAVHGPLSIPVLVNGVYAYRDRDWLKTKYLDENHSISEICQIANVSASTLKQWLRRFDLSKEPGVRTRWTYANDNKPYANHKWMYEHWIVKDMSQEALAELAGVSTHTIRSWVKKHKLQKSLGSWSIGRKPWNWNKRYRAGWNHTEEMRNRFSQQKRGENNPGWRGGVTPRGIQLRREANKLRMQVYQRDAYRCRFCGRKGFLTLHHILPIWARLDLAQDIDNLATLCRKCHLQVNGHELDYVVTLGRHLTEIPPDSIQPKGRGHLLIPRIRRIKQVTYAGEQMTYDIEMDGPHHNFVAEGIVTHNSQVSQRYVSGRVLRFVERPEYAADPELHAAFERRIDQSAANYEQVAQRLLAQQKEGAELLSADAKTDLRKKVQQAARSLLPNETEAPIVVTGNVRAWRHFLEMRASAHAEIEIRALAFAAYLCLVTVEPMLFEDYRIVILPDGTYAVETELMKV